MSDVMVAGESVVENRTLTRVAEARIRRDVAAHIDAIGAISTERTCHCSHALNGGFHGAPPEWSKKHISIFR